MDNGWLETCMPTQSRYGFADSCLNNHKIEMFCEFISWVVKKKTKTKKKKLAIVGLYSQSELAL